MSSALTQIARAQSIHRRHQLRHRARTMRRHPTHGEQALWFHIRAKQIHGVQFRRQVIRGNHIVDFLASSIRLVIEVDGLYHASQSSQDAKRQARLERAGYVVLRLQDELIIHQPQVAVARVAEAVARLLRR